jgi:ArsR family transcriptional regulator
VPKSEAGAELFTAMAHPARIRSLEILAVGELSVGDLQPRVGIETSHLPQQLGGLRRAGPVSTRKVGSSAVYVIKDPELIVVMASARRLLLGPPSETRDLLSDLQPPGEED